MLWDTSLVCRKMDKKRDLTQLLKFGMLRVFREILSYWKTTTHVISVSQLDLDTLIADEKIDQDRTVPVAYVPHVTTVLF